MHGDLRLSRTEDFSFAARAHSIPLGLGELEVAAQHYPILFAPRAEAGADYAARPARGARLIEAFRGHGEVASETADFAPAFKCAADSSRPVLLELCINPEQITTRATIADLRTGKPAPKPQAKPKRAAAPKHPGPRGGGKPAGKRG